jgi:prevent-host-death family protein
MGACKWVPSGSGNAEDRKPLEQQSFFESHRRRRWFTLTKLGGLALLLSGRWIDVAEFSGYTCSYIYPEAPMRFASVAEVKNQLSRYLAEAKKTREPIIVTHHGKPYALIQTITEKDLEELGWKHLAEMRLEEAWVGEDDALYDYL